MVLLGYLCDACTVCLGVMHAWCCVGEYEAVVGDSGFAAYVS